MARNGFAAFLRTTTRIAKAMEREGKRQARITAQRLRAEEREQRRLDREWKAQQRQEERRRMADLREQERLGRQQAKEAVQAFLKAGQDALALRCKERASAREALLCKAYH